MQPDEIHPLYLALGAHAVLAAMQSGGPLIANDLLEVPGIVAAGRELIELLLQHTNADMNFAVRALCACRRFDWDIYQHLAMRLSFTATVPVFTILIQYPFVWTSEHDAPASYRIHDLLRRLMHEGDTDTIVAASHRELEAFYKQRVPTGMLDDVVEALYHANQVEWARGVEEWCSVFEDAVRWGQYAVCDGLLTLGASLIVKTAYWRGRMAHSSGEYYQKAARYRDAEDAFRVAINAMDEALDESDEEDALTIKAATLGRLEEMANIRAQYEQADSHGREAFAVYDTLVRRFPISQEAKHNRAVLLQIHGQVESHLGRLIPAANCFRRAVAAHNGILHLNPDHVEAYNNRGNAFQALGRLEVAIGRAAQAERFARRAITSYDEALSREPDRYDLCSNKATALQQLAEAQEQQGDHNAALVSLERSIATFNEALARTHDVGDIYSNKAASLGSIARLHVKERRLQEAATVFMQAIESLDEALQRASSHIYALGNKGLVLSQVADIRRGLGDEGAAVCTYLKAFSCFEEALRWAPNERDILIGQAGALLRYGQLRHVWSKSGAIDKRADERHIARTAYRTSLDILNRILEVNWGDSNAHIYRRDVLCNLAQWCEEEKDDEAAMACYNKALVSSEALMTGTPATGEILTRQGQILMERALAESRLSRRADAIESAIAAVDAINRALTFTPENAELQAIRVQAEHLRSRLSGV